MSRKSFWILRGEPLLDSVVFTFQKEMVLCIMLVDKEASEKFWGKRISCHMNEWINILDEEILKTNVNFAALFVLNFECLKEFVIEQVRGFYSNHIHVDGDKIVCEESEEYKRRIRKPSKSNIENESLKWFIEAGAITQDDYDTYQIIRKRRNDITHELLKNLSAGFHEDDMKLFFEMATLYQKIDKWWINEIEIPTSADDIPADYDREGVCGGQAMCLEIINDIILGNGGEKYKDVLEELMALNNLREVNK